MFILNLFLSILLSHTSVFAAPDSTKGGWSHLELGAANYGATPPKTREKGLQGPIHEDQYKVLYETVESFVSSRGSKGTVYLNDLDAPNVHFAATKLRAYLEARGLKRVQVVELPGDFTKIDLPKVQTAHLKNPEKGLFYVDNISRSLQRIADVSESGLMIQTYFESQMLEQLNPKEVRLSQRLGDGDAYLFPSGKVVVEKNRALKGQPRIPGRYTVTPTHGCGVAFPLSKLGKE